MMMIINEKVDAQRRRCLKHLEMFKILLDMYKQLTGSGGAKISTNGDQKRKGKYIEVESRKSKYNT